MRLEGRVAVITGAAGGIGRALAGELAARGCHLALADIGEAALAEAGASLRDRGVHVSTHRVDVTSRTQMAALPAAVLAEHGGVHLLINNAGITLQKRFATHTLDDWDRIVGINLWGVIHGCHFFLPALRAADAAHIVNLSSMVATIGLPSQSSYCATKAAIKALSESMWAELAVEGIGVTCVQPGAIRTEMMKATLDDSDDRGLAERAYAMQQRFGTSPERAARKIVRAVERGRMRVRIGPDAYLLDWLKRLLPTAIHKPFPRAVAAAFD